MQSDGVVALSTGLGSDVFEEGVELRELRGGLGVDAGADSVDNLIVTRN